MKAIALTLFFKVANEAVLTGKAVLHLLGLENHIAGPLLPEHQFVVDHVINLAVK